MKYTYEQPDYLDANGVRHLVQELKQYILDILDGNIDITQYATKNELTQAVNSIDLSSYAKATDIPSLEGYADKAYVDNAVANVATGGEVDLSNYYTKQETYNKEEVVNLIPDAITEQEIQAMFTGYATETYVDSAVSAIPATDLSNYYTKEEVYTKTETDALIANNSGEDTSVDPEPTILGTAYISGNTTLKAGFTRTYTGSFLDVDGNAVEDVTGIWTISDCSFADSEFTTKDITNTTIKLGVDNEDLIGETFTVTYSDVDGKYTPASVTVEIDSAF